MTYASRVDRKYLLPETLIQAVLAAEPDAWTPDETAGPNTQRYNTEYFDTPDLRFFHAARGRHPLRGKVRVRHYLDTGDHFIEVKRRSARGETTKARAGWTGSLADAEPFLRTALGADENLIDLLEPSASTDYERTAMTLAGNGRLTIDRNLAVGSPNDCSHQLRDEPFGETLAKLVIVETKSPDQSPTALDKRLWKLGYRPQSLSKYALAIASFRPDLPLNRWTRAASHLHPIQ